jgi:cardiolipin-specific phospholipase
MIKDILYLFGGGLIFAIISPVFCMSWIMKKLTMSTTRVVLLGGLVLVTALVSDVALQNEVLVNSYIVIFSVFLLQTVFSLFPQTCSIIWHAVLAISVCATALYILISGNGGSEYCIAAGFAVVVCSFLFPLAANNLWVPVSAKKLKETEETLLKVWCPNVPVRLSVVGGLGTYAVSDLEESYQDNNGEEEVRIRDDKVPLVMIHGYGAGNGYWALNIQGLSSAGFQVFCVELPGMGRSDRPVWQSPASTDEALNRFASKLEGWRNEVGLDRFVLLGHSLGTHAASAYALLHPSRVMHLVLASPVGVGLPPIHLRKHMAPEAILLAQELGIELQLNGEEESTDEEGSKLPKSPVAAIQGGMATAPKSQSLRFKAMVAFASWYWTSEWTPFDLTRLFGPIGPTLVAWAFAKRISRTSKGSYLRKLSEQQVDALNKYTYQNHAAPASGERILNSILIPGAFARKPLVLWLLGGKGLGRISCPVTLIYGTKGVDWMQASFGYELCENLVKQGVDATLVEMNSMVGHLNYLEDPAQFCKHVKEQVLSNKRLKKSRR